MNEANWFTNETTKLLAENLTQRSKLDELERQNVELRSLLQNSLEWLDDYGMRMSGTSNLVDRIETALRKEAQP